MGCCVPLAQFIYGLHTPLILWLGGRMVMRPDAFWAIWLKWSFISWPSATGSGGRPIHKYHTECGAQR